MSVEGKLPHLSVAADDPDRARLARLHHAYDRMGAVVRVLWPGEAAIPSRDPDAVTWAGAVVSLTDSDAGLNVFWKDEDHHGKFAKVVELAWSSVTDGLGLVVHRNADPGGTRLEGSIEDIA
jgi:hypothetical protein